MGQVFTFGMMTELAMGLLRSSLVHLCFSSCERRIGSISWSLGSWEVELKRQNFDWETEVWGEFSEVLNNVYLDDNVSNKIISTPKPSGVFFYKSFKRRMTTVVPIIPAWKVMWTIDMLTKIKTSIWLLLQGRFLVRHIFFILNLISPELNKFPFCGGFEKNIYHLFIHCKKISPIWHKVASLWDVSLCVPDPP